MCGIAGIVALDAMRSIDDAPITAMLSCIRHRGPDDEGTWRGPDAVIGHRRLSVIDLVTGHQPVTGSRPTTIAVVNGEVYNYRELTRELAALGCVFRTKSDSEVVAHAWDAWGAACFDRFDGMFALAIWDAAEHRLVLARDRMGEKPLFFTTADQLMIFASELSALLAHPAVVADIDPCALREYLTFEYVPAPRSLIRNVHKLEPGTFLMLERGSHRIQRYWRLDPVPVARPLPYGDAVARLRTELETAVGSRLVSDVPLGVFLSGGIDSSTVAALAARHGALDTFSIGFDEPSFDESSHARAVAAHIGSRHHERIVLGHEMPDLVPSLGSLLDEPIGDASILPTAILSRFAREHVTVALGGDGGDELFAGYPMHQGHRAARWARLLPGAVLRAGGAAAGLLPVSHGNFTLGFRARTFLRGAAAAAPGNHGIWMSSFEPGTHAGLIAPDVLRAARTCDPFDTLGAIWSESRGAPLLARACHLDARMYLPNDVLVKVDRASMAVALEVRAPLLARAVVEFAFSLPDAYRMRGLSGKRILRDAARDLVPDAILHRPKKGFGVPVAAWIAGPLRALTHDILSADSLRAGGLLQAATVQRLLREHDRREADHRKPLWTLLMLSLWQATLKERVA